MLDALISGTTDPEILAQLARGRLRSKIPALREALEGRFCAHHGLSWLAGCWLTSTTLRSPSPS